MGVREQYFKSIFERAKYKTQTLNNFKDKVKDYNSNFKIEAKKTPEDLQLENHRHKQNKLAILKRGDIYFDYETSKKLIEGKYHEEYDLNDSDECKSSHEDHALGAHNHHFMDTIEL